MSPSHERRLKRRAAERQWQRATASTERRTNHMTVAELMTPGTPRKHKRTAQPAQPSGDGRGLSGWSKPANLPYRLSAVANNPQWSF